MTTFLFVTQPKWSADDVDEDDQSSCAKTTLAGDTALVYVTGGRGVIAEWAITTDAEDNPRWKWMCGVRPLYRFNPAISIKELRAEIPDSDWSAPATNFRGMKAIRLAEKIAERIRALRSDSEKPRIRAKDEPTRKGPAAFSKVDVAAFLRGESPTSDAFLEAEIDPDVRKERAAGHSRLVGEFVQFIGDSELEYRFGNPDLLIIGPGGVLLLEMKIIDGKNDARQVQAALGQLAFYRRREVLRKLETPGVWSGAVFNREPSKPLQKVLVDEVTLCLWVDAGKGITGHPDSLELLTDIIAGLAEDPVDEEE